MDSSEFEEKYIKEIDGKFYIADVSDKVSSLPEDLHIPGDLVLQDDGLFELPANLTVEGNLDLGGTSIQSIGPYLVVEGALTLDGSHVARLPDNMIVGRLILENSEVEEIGHDLTVENDLDLEGTKVTSIGSHLMVDGALFLGGSRLKALPEYTEVKKLIPISCDLAKLPAHLEVKFDWFSSEHECLDLSNTKIKTLGEHTFVDGSLDLSNTGIEKLPENLWIGGKGYNVENIKQNGGAQLILKNTSIRALPDNLHAEVLDLHGTHVDSYGKNTEIIELFVGDNPPKGDPAEFKTAIVYVDGNCQAAVDFAFSINPKSELIIRNGSPRLPEKFPFSGALRIENARLEKFIAHAYLERFEIINTFLPVLPAGIQAGSVRMEGRQVACRLEDGFICGTLEIVDASVTGLPDNFQCDKLTIINSSVEKLPDNIIYPMKIHLKDTAIKKLPDNLEIKKLVIETDGWTWKDLLPASRVIINEHLHWRNFPYHTIPDNLLVFGNIEVPDSNITWLPDNFIVRGNLDLSNNPIEHLPTNLLVYGDLDIENTNVGVLPKSLKVLGNIFSSGKCESGGRYVWETHIIPDGRIPENLWPVRYCGKNAAPKIPDGRIPSWGNGRFIHIPKFGNFEIMARIGDKIRLRKICTHEEIWVEKRDYNGINIFFKKD